MALNFLKHRWQKVALISLLVITGVVLILAFLVNQYWSPVLAKKVKSAVLSGTDSLYQVDFSSAELHVLEGRIIIYNITIKPDTAVYNRLKEQHLAPNNLINLHVKRLVVAHIHPFKLYFEHILDIGRISLNAPELRISYQLNHTRDTINSDHRTAWQKISKTLKLAHVGDIFLDDVNFKYDDYSGNKLVISELKEMNVHASDLLIDSATQTDRSRMLYCKDIVAELNNYKGQSASGLYKYAVKKLTFSTYTSQLNAEGLSLEPINATTFFDKTRQDRYSFYLDSLQLNKFDFLTYHKYRSLNASSLIITNGTFSLFNNPDKIQTDQDKINSFPNVAIYKLNMDLKLDTIMAKRINLIYTEHNKKSDKTGGISFNKTNGLFLNVTTNKEALQKNNICTARVTSHFMDHGLLKVFFTFNLTAPDAAYSYKGSVGPMNLEAINSAIVPLAMVKITSGTLKSFNFDVKGNSRVAKGKVTLLYNDLKVKLLKPDTAHQKLKRKIIETIFANVFILKHSNPDQEGLLPRSFNVVYTRPVNSPFFKTAWQTLLTGIKPSAGYDIKTQQATTAKLAERDINKANRKIKKEIRKEKRAERKMKRQLKKEQKEAEKNAGGDDS